MIQDRWTCFTFAFITGVIASVPGIDTNDGMVQLMMFRYSGYSYTSLESFITLMVRLDKMSSEWMLSFKKHNPVLGGISFISSDWRGIIKSEQTQTVRRIRAGTLYSQFQNIAYVASQNETFVVLLSSQIFSMTRHQTESFTCPGTRWLYFHLMPLILLTTHPTYRKMTRGGICWNRRSNNAEKVMLCII